MQRRTIFASAFAVSALAFATNSGASADYPAAIRDKALLAYIPACTLCHAERDGSDGVVVTDFGRTLWALGMRGRSVSSLESALDQARARRWDTDGDGVSDVDELIGSTDPSGPALSNYPPAEHGCSVAQIQDSPTSRVAHIAFFVGACAASRFRRRAGTQARPSRRRRRDAQP